MLFIWAIVVEIILCLCPFGIITLAKLQNQKAKAIAAALNWKAKNNYKMALAGTRKNLFPGKRFARESRIESNKSGYLVEAENVNTATSKKKKRELRPLSRYDNEEENRYEYLSPDYYDTEQQISFYGPVEEDDPKSSIGGVNVDHDISLFEQHFPSYKHHDPNFRSISVDHSEKNAGFNLNVDMNRTPSSEIHGKNNNKEAQIVGKKEESPIGQNNILGEENDRENKVDHEDNRMRSFSADKFYYNGQKYLPKPEEIYTHGSEENPKPMADYGQDATYNQPDNNIEEKNNMYDSPIHGYSVPKPPIPTAYPVEVAHPTLENGKFSKMLHFEYDYYANLISGLQAKLELLIDMLKPIATKMDSQFLNELELLNKLKNKKLSKLTPTPAQYSQPPPTPAQYSQDAYVGQPLEPPENHFQLIPHIDEIKPKNPLVSHVIQIPNNYYDRYYQRNVRSTNNNLSNQEYLNELMQEGSEILNFLKTFAKNENDVLKIDFAAELLHKLSENADKEIKKRSVPVAQ